MLFLNVFAELSVIGCFFAFRSLSSIVGYCQNYVWGNESYTSIVANFYRTQRAKSVRQEQLPAIDPGKRYAELWFGAHPAGHATLSRTGGLFNFLCDTSPQSPFAHCTDKSRSC